jgi:hypothetical protein
MLLTRWILPKRSGEHGDDDYLRLDRYRTELLSRTRRRWATRSLSRCRRRSVPRCGSTAGCAMAAAATSGAAARCWAATSC